MKIHRVPTGTQIQSDALPDGSAQARMVRVDGIRAHLETSLGRPLVVHINTDIRTKYNKSTKETTYFI